MATGAVSCRDIYLAALELLGEAVSDTESDTDLALGATYHLASFCCECAPLDALYRRQHGMAPADDYSSIALPPDAPFPLIPRLVPAATAYLASMLVLDADEELSERLYGRYCDLMATLCTSIPGAGEVIG